MLSLALAMLLGFPERGCFDFEWKPYGIPQPCTENVPAGDAGTALFAEKWKLSLATAALAAAAWRLGRTGASAPKWIEAIKSAPERLELVAAFALRAPDDGDAEVIRGIEATKNPPAAARLLLKSYHHIGAVALWAIAHDPNPAELLDLPFVAGESLDGVVVGVRGTARVAKSPRAGAWADATLRAALHEGLLFYASELYLGLPAEVRARIDRGEDRRLSFRSDSRPSPGSDLRRSLAIALVATGHPAESRRLAAVASPESLRNELRNDCKIDLDGFALGGAAPEAFSLSVGLRTCRVPPATLLVLRPRLTGADLALVDRTLQWNPQRTEYTLLKVSKSSLRALAPRELDAIAESVRRDAALFTAAVPVPASPPQSAVDAGTPAALYTETAFVPPAGRAPEPCAAALPSGFSTVTSLKVKGGGCVAVAASQALDPTGEVSEGGYWLFRSTDGRTWGRGFYLGLRVYRPYHAVERASVLPLDKSMVRLVVERKELDEGTISFPPVAMQFKKESGPLILEAKWSDIARDLDRDGLTDLEEERMQLDPRNADTDGDG